VVSVLCVLAATSPAYVGGCADPVRSETTAVQNRRASERRRDDDAPKTEDSAPDTPSFLEVRVSDIPTAGEGLFATADIASGSHIGNYSGRYVTREESDAMSEFEAAYLFEIPICAETQHDSIAGNPNHYVSKANYAPSMINGTSTGLQNVGFETFCGEPYVRLFATRDIRAGEELYADYGEVYDYGFMESPEVRRFFVEAAGVEARTEFDFEYSETNEPGLGGYDG
jgi:hypothetical protein